MKRFLVCLAVILLFVAGFDTACAQVVFGEPPSGHLRFVYQSWSIDSDVTGEEYDLSQWYMPIYGFIPVSENWEIHFQSASAGSNVDSSGGDASITGLNDTRVSVLHSLLEDRLLLGLGLNLPTGKATLDPDQTGLAQLLAEEFLSFPSKSYGEGFGLYLETVYARSVGRLTYGAGIGYLINTSYSPIRDVDSYNPGNKLTIGANAVLRHDYGSAYSYIRHNIYGTSTQDDIDVYEVGPITEFALGSSFISGQFEADAGIRLLLRQADSRLVSGVLEEYEENNYGNDFRFYSDLGYRLRNIGKGSILIDYKHVSANGFSENHDLYVGKSDLFGIGIGFLRAITNQVEAYGSIKTMSGSADDENLDLSGFELSMFLRVTI